MQATKFIKSLYKPTLLRGFATLDGVPLIDTQNFMSKKGDYLEDCKKVAESFRETGCLAIRDPRVNQKHNDDFLNMMENYFESRSKRYYSGEQNLEDFYPQLGYQTGATPEGVEKARDHKDQMASYQGSNKAVTPSPPPADAKWRFFWRIGEKPPQAFGKDVLDIPYHVPKDFPEWEFTMNQWGYLMHDAVWTVSEMVALGLGLPQDTFTSRMKYGNHLLAPTGSDLDKYDLNTIFAGFHYDLNYITIHGKSRYPGLFVWLRDGRKISVSIPEGCLLLQSGKQMEILTGGYLPCGYHEVIYTDRVREAKEKAKKEGRSTWRVSSTLFAHIRSDAILEPLPKFKSEPNASSYKPMTAGEQVEEELKAINLFH